MKTLSYCLALTSLLGATALAAPPVQDKAIDVELETVLARLEAHVTDQAFVPQDFELLKSLLQKRIADARKQDPAGHPMRLRLVILAAELQAAATDTDFQLGKPDFADMREEIVHAALRTKMNHARAAAAQGKVPAKLYAATGALLQERRAVQPVEPLLEQDGVTAEKFLESMQAMGAASIEPPIIIDHWNTLDSILVDQRLRRATVHVGRRALAGRVEPVNFERLRELVADRAAVAPQYPEISVDQDLLMATAKQLAEAGKKGSVDPVQFDALRARVVDMGLRRAISDLQAHSVGKPFGKPYFLIGKNITRTRELLGVSPNLTKALKTELAAVEKAGAQRQLGAKDFARLNELRVQLARTVVQAGFSGK